MLSLHVAIGSRCDNVSQNFILDFEGHQTMLFVQSWVSLHPRRGVVRENGIDEDSILSYQSWFGLVLQVTVDMLRGGQKARKRNNFALRPSSVVTYPIERRNDEGDSKIATDQWGRHVRHHSLVQVKCPGQLREHVPVLLPRVIRNAANDLKELLRFV